MCLVRIKNFIVLLILLIVSVSSCRTVEQNYNNFELVDLGLPSGTLWLDRNLGAQNIYDFGLYFSWAEIQSKTYFAWDNYKYYVKNHAYNYDEGVVVTKYNCYKDQVPFFDGKMNVENVDDIVCHFIGTGYSIPTFNQMKELIDVCNMETIDLRGAKCMVFTGPNGRKLYLPFAGYKDKDKIMNRCNLYWTSSLHSASEFAWALSFTKNEWCLHKMSRFYGIPVRGVKVSK